MDRAERDQRLRAALRRRMDLEGVTEGQIAARLGDPTKRDRYYKAMSGENRITPGTLKNMADALDLSVEQIQYEAGVMGPDDERRFLALTTARDALAADRRLSPRQRRILIDLYDEMVEGRSA